MICLIDVIVARFVVLSSKRFFQSTETTSRVKMDVNETVQKQENTPNVKDKFKESAKYILTEKTNKSPAPTLGVLRLDYDYPPAKGDVDCPESFPYEVFYKVVPGLTFEMCQSGVLTDDVKENLINSVQWLVEEKKVRGITGDCGFMMYYQSLVREITQIPVFMSALCQLPAVTCAYSGKEQIIIMTANGSALENMTELIRTECGVRQERYHIIGCEDVPGFEAVALGERVNTEEVEPGIVEKALEALRQFPQSRAFLLECTELPPYADAIRQKTGLPVFDAITACNFFIGSLQDDPRFGLQDWQCEWERKQDKYSYGDNLTEVEMENLVYKPKQVKIESIEDIDHVDENYIFWID